MNRERPIRKLFSAIYHYLTFFVLVSIMATCVVSLFAGALSRQTELVLTPENLGRPAKLTFLCVLLLSLLFTLIDTVRRKLTTEKVVKRITRAAKEVVQGNFDTRIAPVAAVGVDDNFNEIIACFNEMAAELGSLETLRTDFVANVSHEMKTPLAVMQNYATLLRAPDLPEDKRMEYANGVADGAERLSDMMTNILKLNRLENQKIYPKREKFDLGEQLCESLLQYESVWEQAQIEIETEIAENVTVRADSELLRLVWNNLFSNAFKFTPAGGTVTVSLVADAVFATVTIRDTGCGMSAEVGSHIFEKFYQGDSSHATQGNGLGLALVKRVVDILHAQISVESTVGVGTVFTVRIRRDGQ